MDGFYLGPALDHYRCYKIYVYSTKSVRISDTLAWFPTDVRMPGSSPHDLIHAALLELTTALKTYLSQSVSTGQPIALTNTLTAALRNASNLFSDTHLPPHVVDTVPTIDTSLPLQSVISPAPPTTTTILQRVPSTDPSVPTVHLQRVSTTDLSTLFPPTPSS